MGMVNDSPALLALAFVVGWAVMTAFGLILHWFVDDWINS